MKEILKKLVGYLILTFCVSSVGVAFTLNTSYPWFVGAIGAVIIVVVVVAWVWLASIGIELCGLDCGDEEEPTKN